MARLSALWRYPVKSMLGESLTECEVGPSGLEGDRAFALVDLEDGTVASAKNPRKWGVLMSCRATWLGAGTAEITLPDGTTVRTDEPDVDDRLSKVVGRPVRLASTAPDDRTFEEVWPDIGGLAPDDVIQGTTIGTEESGEPLSKMPLGMRAPAGTFFDLYVVHLLTTATLDRLRELAPSATFDFRRYRPNFVIDTEDEPGFVENEWAGRTLEVGGHGSDGGVRLSVAMPAMRCIMTTLPQDDLPRDRETLRAIADHNRVEIAGFFGTWACAGAYADVSSPGSVAVGAPVAVEI